MSEAECLGGDCNQDDVRCPNCLYDYVKKKEPEYAHTLDWTEHPSGYKGICYCDWCRSYMD